MIKPDQHNFGQRKRKRSSQENSLEEEIAWTSARCNRLLRTINSRIEAIRQLLRPDVRAPKPAPRPHPKSKKQRPESLTDPAWLPNGAKKSRVQTYAGSRKKKVSRPVRGSESNGEGKVQKIALPSPFLKRIQNFDYENPPSSPLQTPISPELSRKQKPVKLPVNIEDPVKKAEAALCTAFRSFLNVTRAPEPASRKGATSLLQTCLRKVPEYLESQDEAPEIESSHNISDEVWSFFDELVEIKGPTWQGLREVVRGQGLNAIRWAIFDGLLSDDCVEVLVKDGIAQEALAEVEELLVDWYQRSEVVPPVKIGAVAGGLTVRRLKGIHFRIWGRYVEQAPGRFLALVTGFPGLWRMMLRGVAEAGAHDEAHKFLQICVENHVWSLSMSRSHDRGAEIITTKLDELASKLFHLATISWRFSRSNYGQQHRENMYRLGACLLLQGDSQLPTIAVPAILGPVLLHAIYDGPTADLEADALVQAYEHATENSLSRRQLLKREQEFAALIATDLVSLEVEGKVSIIHEVLTRIKKYIEKHPRTPTTAVLRQLAIEILTRLRMENEDVYDTLDQDMGEYITQEAEQTDSLHTPRTRKPRFVWDTNLCEWLARTPFPKQEKKDVFGTSDSAALPRGEAENLDPETPDILAKSVVKAGRPRIAFAQTDSSQCSPLQSRSSTGSPHVKRRKWGGLEGKRSDMEADWSEDELAV
ncbi:hypothetical protein CERZMDRAFT_89148 [Cercospora zeae-maydis SCOH1-5]|uniref:Uncharacterized protein n=1 Tax=Cercospora zeae-maydis SCOH1-5 TaxID=717836 RepID=A0A6A6EWN0_9PEZI|nr:hypothetical protein CERZMDRAFT_89148 [Cercospora zeae-maydis SCOH1-5]